MDDKVRVNRLRRRAQRRGWILLKSRKRDVHAADYGLYALLDERTGSPPVNHELVKDSIYCMDLDQVEREMS